MNNTEVMNKSYNVIQNLVRYRGYWKSSTGCNGVQGIVNFSMKPRGEISELYDREKEVKQIHGVIGRDDWLSILVAIRFIEVFSVQGATKWFGKNSLLVSSFVQRGSTVIVLAGILLSTDPSVFGLLGNILF